MKQVFDFEKVDKIKVKIRTVKRKAKPKTVYDPETDKFIKQERFYEQRIIYVPLEFTNVEECYLSIE